MKAIFNLVSTLCTVFLAVWFTKWYVKGHFGKYAILFFINTIIAICLYIGAKTNKPKEDTTPGYVYWERNVKNH